jgi:hypothetical protein
MSGGLDLRSSARGSLLRVPGVLWPRAWALSFAELSLGRLGLDVVQRREAWRKPGLARLSDGADVGGVTGVAAKRRAPVASTPRSAESHGGSLDQCM